jgi:hypothetical protein
MYPHGGNLILLGETSEGGTPITWGADIICADQARPLCGRNHTSKDDRADVGFVPNTNGLASKRAFFFVAPRLISPLGGPRGGFSKVPHGPPRDRAIHQAEIRNRPDQPVVATDGTGLDRDALVIVKALWEHGSLGLDETSVTRGADAPRAIAALTLRLKTEHFAEAYVEGREFHLALLERISGVEVLPIDEILFGGLEAHAPRIIGYDAKWTPDSAPYIAHCAASVWSRTSPNLPRRSSSSRWPPGPCSASAAMRASIFVSIRPASPSSST